MSACLLQNSSAFHILKDDLESFLHVLGWTTVCYVLAIDSYSPDNHTKDLRKFNENDVYQGGINHGGLGKHKSLGAETYPLEAFQPRKPTPLPDLLTELSMPFQISYSQWVPSVEDRTKISKLTRKLDVPTMDLIVKIACYNVGREQLESTTFFI